MATQVPQLLRDLWRQRARLLATNIATGSREHREIAHASSLIRQDYQDRFLIELLQNANDQALLGGTPDSTVVVVRSPDLLAVSNEGQVMTSRNLERISSLADSDKSGLLVGNKGVGFKAVYLVADAPEIYSAAEDGAGSVFDAFGLGIALEREPFRNEVLAATVDHDVQTFFQQNAGLAASLAERGIKDPLTIVRREYPRVAGFKFPLPRGMDDLSQRTSSLAIPERYLECIRTLVVLPLRDPHANEDVERVINDFVGANGTELSQAELAMLFLVGVQRLVVVDHVREQTWTFERTPRDKGVFQKVVVSVSGVTNHSRTFGTLRRDALECPAQIADKRRSIVRMAIEQFGLEAWAEDDPLPVTVALPIAESATLAPIGPPGRFCVGLPTNELTGLPVHVDARFFATISRKELDFSSEYNGMLLGVATELFEELTQRFRMSDNVDERRLATLAFHRSKGALAERVYAPGAAADGKIVLCWDALTYSTRVACALPSPTERALLPYIESALEACPDLSSHLPDRRLLKDAVDVLESMQLGKIDVAPHPWISRTDDSHASVVELSASLGRADGPAFWEPFCSALLDCFAIEDLRSLSWLPVGTRELAAPIDRVFLPAPETTGGDDEEVADVPAKVAATLRLLDSSTMHLREGRAFTPLALRLAEPRLVRRPRKTDLLEDALFPALEKAADSDQDLALDLFGQAIQWIASMKDTSRRKLDCSRARVPVASGTRIEWMRARDAYLGNGWGLDDGDERLLALAYPSRRLVPFSSVQARFALHDSDATSWRASAVALGVSVVPRLIVIDRNDGPPLQSANYRLLVKRPPKTSETGLDAIYSAYVQYLTRYSTPWAWTFDHDVEEVKWVDGLEDADQRPHVLDLILRHSDVFLRHARVLLRRVDHHQSLGTVPQMWVFALSQLGWSVFPAERGAGGESIRTSASQLWRLPEDARRTGYAQMLTVVPHALLRAGNLFQELGVPSIAEASIERLLGALTDLARRLDSERLHSRREAFSLANELFVRIDSRLETESHQTVPENVLLPLLKDRALHSVDPTDPEIRIAFDDEPIRARYVSGLANAFTVPFARDAAIDRVHAWFVRTWGADRVLRTSTAPIGLSFRRSDAVEKPFLQWLSVEYPHVDVAMDLAALLTFSSERFLRSERVSRNWRAFENLNLVFGSFEGDHVTSFYDKVTDKLWTSSSLMKHQVVEATWEVAGIRARNLWEGYARALQDGLTRTFLQKHEISDVDVIEVADAAGLSHGPNIDSIAPALLAAFCHVWKDKTLDDAATWFGSARSSVTQIALGLGRPDLESVLTDALALRSPDGELLLLRHLGVPWGLWHEAVVRRDGRRYLFSETIRRYSDVREHLVAVIRELAARDAKADLAKVGEALTSVLSQSTPEHVGSLPIDVAKPDDAAWESVHDAVANFPSYSSALETLPRRPWSMDLPIPKDATKRGVRLFREMPLSSREVEARTSAEAVIRAATSLAPFFNEKIDGALILADERLATRMSGDWAHVYAALSLLRDLLSEHCSATMQRLTDVLAFRDSTTFASLLAKLPQISREAFKPEEPKQMVLGDALTAAQVQADMRAGSNGTIGAKLALAAAKGIDPGILQGVRKPLQPLVPRERSKGKRGSGRPGRIRREPAMVGDLGEAFVHEWLSSTLGTDYSADCWLSSARERYGFPPCGDDNAGYDFRVVDVEGRLFGRAVPAWRIEVKSSSTDDDGPFPMSRPEWEEARRCHETASVSNEIYVILRVATVMEDPRISDVLVDPFAAFQRGELRLAERDLWVTISPVVEDDLPKDGFA